VIFEHSDVVHEAQSFVDQASSVNLTAIEKFLAAVVSQDPDHVRVAKLLNDAGYIVRNSSAEFSCTCVATLTKWMHKDFFEDVLKLSIAICEPKPINSKVTTGLFSLENFLQSQKSELSLLQPKWRRKMLHIGLPALERACDAAMAFYGSGGARSWSAGLVKELNKGIKTAQRLPNPWSD
jgi:hypothetical protein